MPMMEQMCSFLRMGFIQMIGARLVLLLLVGSVSLTNTDFLAPVGGVCWCFGAFLIRACVMKLVSVVRQQPFTVFAKA